MTNEMRRHLPVNTADTINCHNRKELTWSLIGIVWIKTDKELNYNIVSINLPYVNSLWRGIYSICMDGVDIRYWCMFRNEEVRVENEILRRNLFYQKLQCSVVSASFMCKIIVGAIQKEMCRLRICLFN